MAELTFKSPGVSTKEIDLSGPTQTGPSGSTSWGYRNSRSRKSVCPYNNGNVCRLYC